MLFIEPQVVTESVPDLKDVDVRAQLARRIENPAARKSQDCLSDSNLEVKRRRHSNSTPRRSEPLVLRSLPESIEKPKTLQLKSCVAPSLTSLMFNKSNHSSSAKSEFDSLDESLGILTPEQMKEDASLLMQTRSPSLEYEEKAHSPNTTDFSFGIISEQAIANLSVYPDTNVNAEALNLGRMEQTPSPEELPLDPTPIVEPGKAAPAKAKTINNFVTSITSITSLDTGYQGDGEMSRPASRGADSSPLTRRPLPRPQARRQDPMTDSDFYTESDADNHEDGQLKGDRKAQVIDGTLYGVDPQAAADIYVNNRENMDSSGIFTDMENTRTEDDGNGDVAPDPSPSDSTKTISVINSQNVLCETYVIKDAKEADKQVPKETNPKKRTAPSPRTLTGSPNRHGSNEGENMKKYKMPKRDIPSKVKSTLKSPQVQTVEKEKKKPAGRWDAVMSKITKGDQKTNLKEVKSKVYNIARQSAVQKAPSNKTRRVRIRSTTENVSKIGNFESSIHSSLSDLSAATLPPNSKTIGASKKREVVQVTQVLTASKLPRTTSQTAVENKKNATLHPSPSAGDKTKRAVALTSKEKKQIANKECSRGTPKGGRTSPNSVRPPQQQQQQQQQRQTQSANAAVVSKSQQVQLQPQPRIAEALAVLVQHLVFNVEAYQVPTLRREVQKYRLEAEEVRLACQNLEETLAQERVRQIAIREEERERCRKNIAELLENHRGYVQELNAQSAELERRLVSEKDQEVQRVTKYNEEQLTTLKQEYEKLQRAHEEALVVLREENDSIREQIDEYRIEASKSREKIVRMREEYECREAALKEANHKLKQQVQKLQSESEEKMRSLTEENKRLRDENDRLLGYGDDKGIGLQEVQSLRVVLELKQSEVAELRRDLAEANHKVEALTGAEDKSRMLNARCEDLELQLQRKSEYVKSIIQENKRLQEILCDEKNQKKRLSQYNEELQWRLKQKQEVMTELVQQASETSFNRTKMHASFNERHSLTRPSHERRLSVREGSFSENNSMDDSYYSCRQSTDFMGDGDLSPPTSPQVKVMVKKSDSVSYVLDLEESPAEVASRIIRRSFRNTTPPKNTTPTKSPANKRPRIRSNPLSQSASTSSVMGSNKTDSERPHSADVRNSNEGGGNGSGDNFRSPDEDHKFRWTITTQPATPQSCGDNGRDEPANQSPIKHLDLDELDDIQLPALPIDGTQTLPTPKHLASDSTAASDSSEDESTSSSQL